MEQRPLRLGDIVDDYCPRERRITNHAIVAIVEENIRQTRCMTCDAEHVYKDGKAPRRRKPDEPSPDQPIGQIARPVAVAGSDEDEPSIAAAGSESSAMDASDESADASQGEPGRDEFWPAHRTLIRASLPKIEGEQPPPRPIPEFTMHQRGGRGPAQFRGGGGGWSNGNGHGHFRQGRPQGQGEVNGNTTQGHGRSHSFGQNGQGRSHSPRPGGQGHGHGAPGGGQPGGPPGGGQPGGARPGGGGGGGRHRHRGGGRHKPSN